MERSERRTFAIARFSEFRAHFNKRSTPAFSKTDPRSDTCNVPPDHSNIDEVCFVRSEAARHA
jgi:hypothetical protein